MSLNTDICISVIDAGLEILRYQRRYPDLNIDSVIRQLRGGPSNLSELDYEAAIRLAKQVGWDSFCLNPDRRIELSDTLMELVLRMKPNWAHVATNGRKNVRRFINEDEEQCLKYAGLLDSELDERVIQWWDKIATSFRQNRDERNLEIGREGERLTLIHETARLAAIGITDHAPILVSIDDNNLGYDVISYNRTDVGEVYEIKIEVKASSSYPVRFFITRNEWDTAQKYAPEYLFYVWNLEIEELRVLSVSFLASHIPIDSGAGRWLKVELQLNDILSAESTSAT